MSTYQATLRRLQPIVPVLFDSFQAGLTESVAEHRRKSLKRGGDPHYFSHTARRRICESLREEGLLVTDVDEERSALRMSGIQVQYNGVLLWAFRAVDGQVPLPTSLHKQRFYQQGGTLDGWDNLLLLWDDADGVLADPMHVIRPLGGDNRRANLLIDWSGPLSRKIATMRVQDLEELRPEHEAKRLEGDESS